MIEKGILSKWTQEATSIFTLTFEKIDFKPKLIRRDRKGYYILIKGKFHQEYVATLNIYIQTQGHPGS